VAPCRLSIQAAIRIAAERVASGFSLPLYVTAPPDDTSRIFVVNLASGTVNPPPFLDIQARVESRGNEQGLLGLAFDPDYATNGRFYVDYTAPGGAFDHGISHISIDYTSGNIFKIPQAR
jgi:hypothetical protein